MKNLTTVSVLTLALAATVFAQTPNGRTPQEPRAAEVNLQAPVPFLNAVHRSGQMEIALASMAQAQGKDSRVKSFAQMLANDHQQAGQELARLAKSKSVSLMDDPGVSAMDSIVRLQMLKGHAFDVAYIDQMIRDHLEAIKTFQQAAAANTDADVKTFASRALPMLEKHLQEARAIKKDL